MTVLKRRILFVDDEPHILQGLRRMLRRMRGEWDMDFAENGPEAIDILDRKPFDVVISDMRMPGMDGAQLLALVQQRYPMTVRIVLSGHSDQEMILKSVRPAHQYLTKPCDSEALVATVRRSCRLRDLLQSESLQQIVSKTEFLPSLPSLYTEVMDELQSADCSVRRVGEIIQQDLSMSSKILQLVNSSFFGFPRHIESPGRAVTLLGLDTVRSLVLSVGLFSKFDPGVMASLNVDEVFRHSIATGAIARSIAREEGLGSDAVDDAFMAGLLHDVGKLVFTANFPDAYRQVLETSREQSCAVYDAETDRFGAAHAEVGAYLLGLWGFADTIVEGVAYHHQPAMIPSGRFSPQAAVYAANLLQHCGPEGGMGRDHPSPSGPPDLEQFHGTGKWPVWRSVAGQVEFEEIFIEQ